MGPQQGRKVFTLQTLPDERDADAAPAVGKVAGFSLHAGVAANADQRDKLERLCRYITRPAIAEKRLSLTKKDMVRYELETPYRDGTTHVIFEPVKLDSTHPLYGVGGATNAITYSTDLLGDVTLIGPGAGRIETGYAIIGDILSFSR